MKLSLSFVLFYASLVAASGLDNWNQIKEAVTEIEYSSIALTPSNGPLADNSFSQSLEQSAPDESKSHGYTNLSLDMSLFPSSSFTGYPENRPPRRSLNVKNRRGKMPREQDKRSQFDTDFPVFSDTNSFLTAPPAFDSQSYLSQQTVPTGPHAGFENVSGESSDMTWDFTWSSPSTSTPTWESPYTSTTTTTNTPYTSTTTTANTPYTSTATTTNTPYTSTTTATNAVTGTVLEMEEEEQAASKDDQWLCRKKAEEDRMAKAAAERRKSEFAKKLKSCAKSKRQQERHNPKDEEERILARQEEKEQAMALAKHIATVLGISDERKLAKHLALFSPVLAYKGISVASCRAHPENVLLAIEALQEWGVDIYKF
ncbi:hypothetical protein PSACC_01624 [Paramicrosporidium saccamoebae]|uniref:Uncharacterized protein n=1 Tax=Paramicrosporidium saccamoebae TaxID=1246581 RepID=A0A2H9TLH6_9FUNG|nr:hypothetical protein PSACC_01624 [Paramicrosporidium saccamoebae]